MDTGAALHALHSKHRDSVVTLRYTSAQMPYVVVKRYTKHFHKIMYLVKYEENNIESLSFNF